MRNFFYASCLASALAFALVQQAAVPNFTGAWTLDKNKSQELSSAYKNFERTSWDITQTDAEISVDESHSGLAVKGPASPPPARPASGGGNQPIGAKTYNLDGSETVKNVARAKFVRKATLSSDGKTLELTEKLIRTGTDGDESTTTTIDQLSLSADGKVLTVIRRKEGSPGPKIQTLVFNK